jgi:hypothetical protein
VVSEVCARGYGAGRARERSARGTERAGGSRSTAHEGIDQADPKNGTMSLFLHTPKLDMVTRPLLTCLVLLFFPYSSFADFSGQVVSVLDGARSKSSRKKGLVETPGAKACTQNLRYAFCWEMNAAITHYNRDYLDKAFYHLERAHILGQSFTFAGGY